MSRFSRLSALALRLARAVGVISRPETERLSYHFSASLPEQFDAVLYFGETRAMESLERTVRGRRVRLPRHFFQDYEAEGGYGTHNV